MIENYDEDNRYILKKKSFIDTKTGYCLNFNFKDLSRVAVQMNCMERQLIDLEEENSLLHQHKEIIDSTLEKYTMKSRFIKESVLEQISELQGKLKKLDTIQYDQVDSVASVWDYTQSYCQTQGKIDALNSVLKLLRRKPNARKRNRHISQQVSTTD